MPMTFSGDGTITGLSAGGLGSGVVTSDTLANSAIYLTAPAGAVAFVCQSTAPTGWLKANGAAISRTTYAALFAAIGTAFGTGDGSTTFNLPDLRGEFLRGWADGRAVDTGRAFGSAQTDAFKTHDHSLAYAGGGNINGSGSWLAIIKNGTVFTQTNDAGNSTETRPRNIALLAIIKF